MTPIREIRPIEVPIALRYLLRSVSKCRARVPWVVTNKCSGARTTPLLSVLDLALYAAYASQTGPRRLPWLGVLMDTLETFDHVQVVNGGFRLRDMYRGKLGNVSEVFGEALCLLTLFRDFGAIIVVEASSYLDSTLQHSKLAMIPAPHSAKCPDFLALDANDHLIIAEAKGATSGSAFYTGISTGRKQVVAISPRHIPLRSPHGRLVIASLLSAAAVPAPIKTYIVDPDEEGIVVDVSSRDLIRLSFAAALRRIHLRNDAAKVVADGTPTDGARSVFKRATGRADSLFAIGEASRFFEVTCSPFFREAMISGQAVEASYGRYSHARYYAESGRDMSTNIYAQNGVTSMLPIGLGISRKQRTGQS